ncbi:MAG: hypothetical protein U1E33_08465 [Rhodospirillales bacterium]
MDTVIGSGDAARPGAAMPERIDDYWSAARFCITGLRGDTALAGCVSACAAGGGGGCSPTGCAGRAPPASAFG